MTRFLRVSYRIKELEKDRNIMIERIVEGLGNDAKIDTVKKGRKGKIKKAAPSDYKGYFTVTILSCVEDFRTKLLKLVLQNQNSNFYQILKDLSKLKEVLLQNYNFNINELILKQYNLNYDNPSMVTVINRPNDESRRLLKSFGADKITKLETLINILKNRNDSKYHNLVDDKGLSIGLDRRMEKFNIEGPLMEKINTIIQDSIMDNHTKQIGIENVALEYDLNWFTNEMNSSIEARSVILHDIYKGFETGLKYITLPYKKK